jgi:hypothetical protein
MASPSELLRLRLFGEKGRAEVGTRPDAKKRSCRLALRICAADRSARLEALKAGYELHVAQACKAIERLASTRDGVRNVG